MNAVKRSLAVAALLLFSADQVLAYRPFDSTDADVARAGEFELELGPLQWLRKGSKQFIQAPAVIANIGFSRDHELVIEGRHEVARNPQSDEPRSALVDNGAFIKQVLRRGVLQDEAGPSIAAEYGLLLPSVHGERGTGFSLAGIVSQRWEAGTVHLNGVIARTREHEPDVFTGVILEGPYSWDVRPVAEFFSEHATGSATVRSRLVGAIWRVRDGLSFDVGVRSAQAAGEAIHEFRLGLTWAFSYRKEQ